MSEHESIALIREYVEGYSYRTIDQMPEADFRRLVLAAICNLADAINKDQESASKEDEC